MSHQLLGRQQRHRKERSKSRHEAAEKRQASAAIYQQQLDQHAIAAQQALTAGLPAPPPPEAPKSKRRLHHTKDGSLRNHRGVKRAPRGGRGGRQADGTAERKDGGEAAKEDDEEEDEEDGKADGSTGRAKEDEKDEDHSSDYTSSSPSDDDTPPDAAVYSFVPPRSHLTAAATAQQPNKPAPGTNKPVQPPSLREQSLLVMKQQSTQQRDELDELLHIDEGNSVGRVAADQGAAGSADKGGQKAKANDLRNLEDELDDLLSL